jgi:hypothetical protein
VNTAQINLKITLKNEVRIRGFGKCVNAVHASGETVKTIYIKLSYSTINTYFFDKINDATWGDMVAQV